MEQPAAILVLVAGFVEHELTNGMESTRKQSPVIAEAYRAGETGLGFRCGPRCNVRKSAMIPLLVAKP